jgi:hypothetical protein
MAAAKNKQKCEKALMANYKKAVSEYHPYLDFVVDESNVKRWYCRIRNIRGRDGEFEGGEYLIEMNADDDYPFTPPVFFVRTPNGVYDGGFDRQVDVCLGNGHLHKDKFAAGQGGMMGFMMMTLNGMMNWRLTNTGHGILHEEYFRYSTFDDPCPGPRARTHQEALDPALNREKLALARASKAYNRKHYPKIMALFDELPFPQVLSALPSAGLPEFLEQAVRRVITGSS